VNSQGGRRAGCVLGPHCLTPEHGDGRARGVSGQAGVALGKLDARKRRRLTLNG
jgi:hypothetical protein